MIGSKVAALFWRWAIDCGDICKIQRKSGKLSLAHNDRLFFKSSYKQVLSFVIALWFSFFVTACRSRFFEEALALLVSAIVGGDQSLFAASGLCRSLPFLMLF